MIFQENYDAISDGWHCGDTTPTGWTSQAGCDSDIYDGITHWCGEVTSGGRSGNSLKMWRKNGFTNGYCGYLNKALTESEFNNHYRELYVRMYMKFPSAWDANLPAGQTHKLNRYYTRSIYNESNTGEWLWDVKGSTFKTGSFSFYGFNYGDAGTSVYYTDTLSNLGVLDGNWHCYEIRMKMNTAGNDNATVQFWIDGVLVYNNSTMNCRFLADDYFYQLLSPSIGNMSPSDTWNFPTNGWYAAEFDDYVVSTDYIGPLGSSSSQGVTIQGGSWR